MEDNKLIEHEVRLDRIDKDVEKLATDISNIREKQSALESIQMVTLEKLSRIEEITTSTRDKLEESEDSEVDKFEKYKFWIITGLISLILGYLHTR